MRSLIPTPAHTIGTVDPGPFKLCPDFVDFICGGHLAVPLTPPSTMQHSGVIPGPGGPAPKMRLPRNIRVHTTFWPAFGPAFSSVFLVLVVLRSTG